MSVLVVDDSVDTADSTAELLRLMGYDSVAAYSGRDALAFCESQLPDVVLLDLVMPEMDGFTLAARIRQRFQFRRPLLIAVTGHPEDAVRDGVADAGFDGCFVKPADMNALGRLLQRFEPLLRLAGNRGDDPSSSPPDVEVFHRTAPRSSTTQAAV